MTVDRSITPRRAITSTQRVLTAQRVLGGSVSNGGGGGGGGGDEGGGGEATPSQAQMLARVGHPAARIERVSGVSASVAQADARRQSRTR